MDDSQWAARGLTDEVLAELYRRGRQYAAKRIEYEHQEDAVQDGMCRILDIVVCPPEDYPAAPDERLKYLTKCLYRAALRYTTRKIPFDTNIPRD